MKTKNLICLAMGLSMAIAFADKPADKTTPERKMTTDQPATSAKPADTAEVTVAEQSSLMDRPAPEGGSLSAMIGDSVTFSTLKKALIAADLDVTLGTKGTYTIFAPTDEAFAKLPAATLTKLMLPENKERLRSLLLYHIVPGKVMAVEFKSGEMTTMNGEKVAIKVGSEDIEVDESKVFSADVVANNGVMHSIGTVLVPKSLDDFAGLDR
jgi:uncharacterized surface protein with fasciclin (FAS1) repeats